MTDNVLSFQLLKIEKGRDKICSCSPPSYELDTTNHIVSCSKCGATVEPFDALLRLSEHMESFEQYQESAINKINAYSEMANKEFKRYQKNKVFKDMDKKYQNGMFPICPKCRQAINPVEIREWVNEKYLDERE